MGLPTPSASGPSSAPAQKAALEETYTAAAQSPTQAALSDTPNANSNSSAPPTSSPSVASLPPEAIELATKLFDYARAGDTPALAQYVAAGIPANLTNGTGDTLLMLAAYHGHAETVAELLRRGADPDVLNAKGQSPLAGAVFKGHVDVVRTLVEQGNADTSAGQPNAVDCARMFRRADMLALFGVNDAT